MFSLQLFGGASIQGSGQPLSGPVTQRRRLALLALLAVPAGRSLARDKVIACLWPESGTDRARHLLSESLYVIRKALGEEAIFATGDELRLNSQLVACDVAEFEAALAQGECERAAGLYRGPFLDGFFLSDCAEFERWAEGERTRLARGYQKALEAAAAERESAGNLAGAVDAWRQLAQHDPYSSHVALSLMRALEAAGDRAGALRHARVHELLLREEFGAEPDPEISALADRLRTEPVSRPGSAAPPSPPAAQPQSAAPAAPAPAAGRPGSEAEPTEAGVAVRAGEEERQPLPDAEQRATPGTEAGTPRWSRYRSRSALLYAATALLVLASGAAVLRATLASGLPGRKSLSPAAATDERSIAVLPFMDLSPDRDHEWFSDGITEELINVLAGIEGVRVAARTSAFAFKGGDVDVREIGRRLGVAHVVEGSVRKAGNRLRITAQLVSVGDGYHLWSQTYERQLEVEDVFQVQDEISRAIAGTLNLRLTGGAAAPLVRQSTEDLETYTLYLQGRHFWNQRTAEGLALGMQRFQQALERDPSFAPAFAGLADSYALLVGYGALSPHQGYPQARAAAERALALDPTLADPHASLALVKQYYEWDWAGAATGFQRALQLSPGNATIRQWYAHFLACRGESEAALVQTRRAQGLDPLSPMLHTAEGHLLYYARRYDEAVAKHHQALAIAPEFWVPHAHLSAVYAQQGKLAQAIAEAAEASRLSGGHPLPTALLGYSYALSGRRAEALEVAATLEEHAKRQYISPAYLAGIQLAVGNHDAAFAWLEKAYDERDDWMVYLRPDPVFDPLRTDSRFTHLLARVGAVH